MIETFIFRFKELKKKFSKVLVKTRLCTNKLLS